MNPFKLKLIAVVCIIFVVACKKKENITPNIVKETPTVPVPVEQKALMPIKIESDRTAIAFKYFKETGGISEIETSDGILELYSYNDNSRLIKYDRYIKGEKSYTVYYVLDKQGNVIQGNQNKVEYGGTLLTPTGTYKIGYNSDNKISMISWYDNNGGLLAQSERTYTPAGAILKTTMTGQNAAVYDYVTDDKNGWCKQVAGNQILSIESLNTLFLSSVGNITKSTQEATGTSETSYAYTYNTDNYPTSWIETDRKGSKTTFKITYK